MIGVQSVGCGLETVVILQFRNLAVELSHLIFALSQIDVSLFCLCLGDIPTYVHGISWHPQVNLGAFQLKVCHSDAPVVLCLCRIRRHGVGKAYLQLCTVEQSMVNIGERLLQIHPVALQVDLLHVAFHPHIGDEAVGVEPQTLKTQCIDFDLFLEQRLELDVYIQLSHICDGVTHSRDGVIVLDDTHIICSKVEGEPEGDMTDRNVHSRLL